MRGSECGAKRVSAPPRSGCLEVSRAACCAGRVCENEYTHSETNMTYDLDRLRLTIVRKVREVRLARGWTQAELARKLGLSQARLSVVERGGGTLSAEQLIAFLAFANLPLSELIPRQDPEDELQNALARLGALHLRELDDVVPTERFERVDDAVLGTLAAPRSARLLVALGPVLVWNIDHLPLDHLHARLRRIGLAHRLGWLVQSLLEGLVTAEVQGEWDRRRRRAELLLGALLQRMEAPASSKERLPDPLDPEIRSVKSLDIERHNSDPVARRWGVATDLGSADFARALTEAAAADG